jgi:hypothetical protein
MTALRRAVQPQEIAQMIARAKKTPRTLTASALGARFLLLLPAIREQARFAFRNERPERRQELIAETIANAFVAFVRLVNRGLDDLIYPTPLTTYAVKQVRAGRRTGSRLNVRDVSSPYAQRAKHFTLSRLDRYDAQNDEWREILIEDRHAGPAQTAAARLDIGAWFATLPRKKRRIAATLATGEATTKAARKFRVSPGRISQLRREFQDSWADFQGEPAFA